MTTEAASEANPAPPPRPSLVPAPPPEPLLDRLRKRAAAPLEELGQLTVMGWQCLKALASRPFELRETVYQVEQLGVKSLPIAAVTATFVGMVMAVQFAFSLEKFGARDYVGRVVGLSMVRELAPALTSLVVGSRIAAGMAAELGSMAVTEQIDAIRALGADPIKKLVLPRVLACLILTPILAAIANVLGFSAAMLVAMLQFGTPPQFFYRSGIQAVDLSDLAVGLGKTPFFGLLIALVGCHKGMTTKGGTEGVGRSTTHAVVWASVAVLLADFFLTKLFMMIEPEP